MNCRSLEIQPTQASSASAWDWYLNEHDDALTSATQTTVWWINFIIILIKALTLAVYQPGMTVKAAQSNHWSNHSRCPPVHSILKKKSQGSRVFPTQQERGFRTITSLACTVSPEIWVSQRAKIAGGREKPGNDEMKSTSGGAERSTIRCWATKVCARNIGCNHYNKGLGLSVPSSDYSVCVDCTDMDSSIFGISPIRWLVHLSDNHGGRCKGKATKYSESTLRGTSWMDVYERSVFIVWFE